MIKSHIEKEKKLTVHTCTGKITAEELVNAIKGFYDGELTADNLWDLTGADVSSLKSDEIRQLAYFVKSYAPPKKTGKTAIVSSKDIAFGFSRMYQTFAGLSGQQVEVQVFRSLEEANEWLSG
ncbi:MAG: hypothetical protein KAW12_07905 [Candidatus Aminicenantes bacterium]|nr:hypothetical protein [Candidatus Aminicenantes bacterium]